MPKRKLRLIPQHDPADIFDDLDALRKAAAASPTTKRGAARAFKAEKRARSTETFARIPHERALKELSGINSTWTLLIILDLLILKSRARNPVKLTTKALHPSGLNRYQVRRSLEQLERAGVIVVERKRGRCPLVLHCWYRRTVG
jgi:hypothetical protein